MRKFLHSLVVLTFVSCSASAQLAVPQEQRVAKANEFIYDWHTETVNHQREFLAKRGRPDGPNEDFDLYLDPAVVKIRPAIIARMRTTTSGTRCEVSVFR